MKSWIMPIGAAAVLAAVIGATYLAVPVLALVLCAASAAIGLGWPRLLGLPAAGPSSAVIAGTGIASVAVVWLVPDVAALAWAPTAVAAGVIAAFVVQLVRGTGSEGRLESVLGTVTGVLLTGMSGGWVAAERLGENAADSPLMLVTGVSSLVAIAACLLPWPGRLVAPLGFVAATAAGPAAGLLVDGASVWAVVLVGAACAAVIVSFRRLVLASAAPASGAGAVAVGVAPIAALGSLVYVLEQLILR